MLFKVYAQNVTRPIGMRIMEVGKDELKKCLEEIFNEANDNEWIDILTDEDEVDDAKIDEAYHAIEKYWDTHHCISPGDYMIVEVENREDIEIPNVCYSDTSIIF